MKTARVRRRVRFGVRSAVSIVTATIVCVAAIILADSYAPLRTRIDLTEARSFSLSERTRAMLARLDGPCDILVVPGGAAVNVEPGALARLKDLVEEIRRASSNVGVVWVDSAAGAARADAALESLAQARAAEIEIHRQAIGEAIATARAIAESLDEVSRYALGIRETVADLEPAYREKLQLVAAAARVRAAELRAGAEATEAGAVVMLGATPIPRIETARESVGAVLSTVGTEMDAAVKTLAGATGSAAASASHLSTGLGEVRDAALQSAERLNAPEPLDLLAVAKLLESESAVVIVTERAVTAIPFTNLFPATPGQPTRFAGEELIATAIGAVTSAQSPVVVFTHAVDQRMLDDARSPVGRDAQYLLALFDRLRLSRADIAEWPVALQPERPTPTTLGAVDRPIVWVVLPSASSAAEGVKRAETLGGAVEKLLRDGESVLLSVEPSTLPRVGSPDPMVSFLSEFAITVDSGRPLLRRMSTPQGSVAWPEFRLPDASANHPVGAATRGLAVNLMWPSAIAIDTSAAERLSVDVHPVLTVPSDGATWGESQWLSYFALPLEQRMNPASQPTPDPQRDSVTGPWAVAVGAERAAPESGRTQRLVVVGAHGWFFDPITQQAQVISGRSVKANPGNAELFEASVQWLAGLDDQIAPSPEAREVARIRPIDPGALAALRWAIVLAPPVVVLLIGGALRLLRG